MSANSPLPARLITKRELSEYLGGSTKQVDKLMRQRQIPFTKLGHRTLRFDREKVIRALGRLEIRAAE